MILNKELEAKTIVIVACSPDYIPFITTVPFEKWEDIINEENGFSSDIIDNIEEMNPGDSFTSLDDMVITMV